MRRSEPARPAPLIARVAMVTAGRRAAAALETALNGALCAAGAREQREVTAARCQGADRPSAETGRLPAPGPRRPNVVCVARQPRDDVTPRAPRPRCHRCLLMHRCGEGRVPWREDCSPGGGSEAGGGLRAPGGPPSGWVYCRQVRLMGPKEEDMRSWPSACLRACPAAGRRSSAKVPWRGPGRCRSVVRASDCAQKGLGLDPPSRAHPWVAGLLPTPSQGVCERQPICVSLSHFCFSFPASLPSL